MEHLARIQKNDAAPCRRSLTMRCHAGLWATAPASLPGSTCSPAAHALPANGPRDLAQHIEISFDCFTCVAKWKVAASCWQLKNPMLWKACRTGKAKGSRSGDASLSLPTAVSHIKLAISQSLPEPCKLYLNWSRPRNLASAALRLRWLIHFRGLQNSG
ncbi:unnamed protein product [Effrenium voratum]|nr:unnamed protein product [Effrenium voratum]